MTCNYSDLVVCDGRDCKNCPIYEDVKSCAEENIIKGWNED